MSNKQQTAVMQIINKFDEIKDLDSIVQLMILRGFIESLLELEKQQIVDAYICGKTNGISTTIGNEKNKPSKQYYKETYGE